MNNRRGLRRLQNSAKRLSPISSPSKSAMRTSFGSKFGFSFFNQSFLLVCLQLIIVLLSAMTVDTAEGIQQMNRRVHGALRHPRWKALEIPSSMSRGGSSPMNERPVARAYRLFSVRAGSNVVIGNKKVKATGTSSDPNGELGLESIMRDDLVRTRIRGLFTDKYLCFNHKGRLVAKPKGRAKGPKCEFIEESEGGFSKFMSAQNPQWYIGFNPKGRPILGPSFEKLRYKCDDCFLFLKGSSTSKSVHPSRLTENNFDPVRHNRRIGQVHPGLSRNFLSSITFLPPLTQKTEEPTSTSSRRKKTFQKDVDELKEPKSTPQF